MDEWSSSLTVLTVVTLLGTAQSSMKLEIRLASFLNGKKVITSNAERRKKMKMTLFVVLLMAGLAFAEDEDDERTEMKDDRNMNQRSD